MRLFNFKLAIVCFLLLLLFNEFTLVYLDQNPPLSEKALKNIRLINLSVFFFPFLYSYLKKFYVALKINLFVQYFINFSNASIRYISPSIITIIVLDILLSFLGFGYESHYQQENIERSPSPYDSFSGKPHRLDHNKYGFRGKFITKGELNSQAISIAFFGGSTGYNGDPPIPILIQNEINKRGYESVVYNFSSTSSNHSQHLHRLLKFHDKFRFDLVIFYGGGNETLQYLDYDPRPGYPFNFFYRQELSPLLQAALRYSSILGEFDKYTGKLSGLSEIRSNLDANTWKESIITRYWKDLSSAKRLTENMVEPNSCNASNFISVLQPANPILKSHVEVWELLKLSSQNVVHESHVDLSNLDNEISFTDIIHIDHQSRLKISKKLVDIIISTLSKNCF